MTDKRKSAVVLRAGAKDYTVIMTMTSNMTVTVKSREPTVAEYITEMHKQWRIEQGTGGHEKKDQEDFQQGQRRSRERTR